MNQSLLLSSLLLVVLFLSNSYWHCHINFGKLYIRVILYRWKKPLNVLLSVQNAIKKLDINNNANNIKVRKIL